MEVLMSSSRFASWSLPFALACALGACADDPLAPTPDDGPAVQLAARSASAYAGPSYLWPFARLNGLPRATATASALPYTGEFCTQSEASLGQWRLQLTARQSGRLTAAILNGARVAVYWGTSTQFHFGGYKSVNQGGSLRDGAGVTLLEVHDEQVVDPDTDGAGTGRAIDGWYDLSGADLAALAGGGTLTAEIWGSALAWVHEDDCGRNVAGAMAMWRIYSEPALFVH
jgi:hypothetical protein